MFAGRLHHWLWLCRHSQVTTLNTTPSSCLQPASCQIATATITTTWWKISSCEWSRKASVVTTPTWDLLLYKFYYLRAFMPLVYAFPYLCAFIAVAKRQEGRCDFHTNLITDNRSMEQWQQWSGTNNNPPSGLLSAGTSSAPWSSWWPRITWSFTWTAPHLAGGCPASPGWRSATKWLTGGDVWHQNLFLPPSNHNSLLLGQWISADPQDPLPFWFLCCCFFASMPEPLSVTRTQTKL